jgi:hypothetical protein
MQIASAMMETQKTQDPRETMRLSQCIKQTAHPWSMFFKKTPQPVGDIMPKRKNTREHDKIKKFNFHHEP